MRLSVALATFVWLGCVAPTAGHIPPGSMTMVPEEDLCGTAPSIGKIGLNIDELYVPGSTLNASPDNVTCSGVEPAGPGAWFKFQGDGTDLQIAMSEHFPGEEEFHYFVFTGESCDDLQCLASGLHTSKSKIQTVPDGTYYVLVHGMYPAAFELALMSDVSPSQNQGDDEGDEDIDRRFLRAVGENDEQHRELCACGHAGQSACNLGQWIGGSGCLSCDCDRNAYELVVTDCHRGVCPCAGSIGVCLGRADIFETCLLASEDNKQCKIGLKCTTISLFAPHHAICTPLDTTLAAFNYDNPTPKDEEGCALLRSADFHRNLRERAGPYTKTFGVGFAGAFFAGVSVEHGVAYGRDGCFGCYRTFCGSLAIEIGVSGYYVESIVSGEQVGCTTDDCPGLGGTTFEYSLGGGAFIFGAAGSMSVPPLLYPTQTISVSLGVEVELSDTTTSVGVCETQVIQGGCYADSVINEPLPLLGNLGGTCSEGTDCLSGICSFGSCTGVPVPPDSSDPTSLTLTGEPCPSDNQCVTGRCTRGVCAVLGRGGVAIRSKQWNRFVGGNANGELFYAPVSIDLLEIWDIIPHPSGGANVGFRSAHGLYLLANGPSNSLALTPLFQLWETWQIRINGDDDSFSLYNPHFQRYAAFRRDGTSFLAQGIGDSERFYIGEVVLIENAFVKLLHATDTDVETRALSSRTDGDRWQLIMNDDGTYALLSHQGTFLCSHPNTGLFRRSFVGGYGRWTLTHQGNNRYTFFDFNKRYLGMNNDGSFFFSASPDPTRGTFILHKFNDTH